MSQPFPHLFQPIRVGPRQSRNRIMRVATSTNTGENGVVTDRAIATYRRVARGGIGVLVTEGMRVHSTTAESRPRGFLLFRKEIIPSLARMAQAIHDEGALLIAQGNHGGRQHQGANIPAIMWGPSAIACPHSGGVPHEMSKAEIAAVGAGFVAAALNAREAGCDGFEVHVAQGHLLQEFVSAFSNQRTDEYGGSLENRLRFVVEIISAIRDKTGPDFIIGVRLGIHEFTPGGIDVESSRLAVQHLLKLKAVDYFSFSQGNFNSIDTHLPDSHFGHLPFVEIQAQVREVAAGVPVAACGRIQTPEEAESIIAGGKADFVGLCRALVADPEWPLKARAGRSEDIVRCISTSECWGREGTATRAARLVCSINPTVGNELEWPTLGRTDNPGKVVVVGGGPAGMEAAHTAAERGHQVVLFERKAALGGKLAGADRFAGYHDVSSAVNQMARHTTRSGVQLRLGVEADVQSIAAERPRTVILASGASVVTPPLAGDGSIPIYAYEGDIPAELPRGDVVVMDEDGYYWAAALTEALARQGRKVTYVTRFLEPLRELPKVSRISTLRALDELGVNCYDNMYVERAEHGILILRHYYNQKRQMKMENISAVVWLGVQRVNDSLLRPLQDAGITDIRVIGDAYAPRRLVNAISEGHKTARAL